MSSVDKISLAVMSMTKRNIFLVSLLFLIFGIEQSTAQPKLPYFDWGANPCEFCLYGEWKATKDTRLLEQRSDRSKAAYAVTPQEKLAAITGVVITTKAGVGTAVESTFLRRYNKRTDTYSDVKIKRNERFYLLTYHGEDVYTVWLEGQILEAHFLDSKLRKLSSPKFIWWVKIKNSKGQIGWTRMTKNFEGPHEI